MRSLTGKGWAFPCSFVLEHLINERVWASPCRAEVCLRPTGVSCLRGFAVLRNHVEFGILVGRKGVIVCGVIVICTWFWMGRTGRRPSTVMRKRWRMPGSGLYWRNTGRWDSAICGMAATAGALASGPENWRRSTGSCTGRLWHRCARRGTMARLSEKNMKISGNMRNWSASKGRKVRTL